MQVTVTDKIYVQYEPGEKEIARALAKRFTFDNPEYLYAAKRKNKYAMQSTPKNLYAYSRENADTLSFPLGAEHLIRQFKAETGCIMRGKPLVSSKGNEQFAFKAELRDYQEKAISQLTASKSLVNTLISGTGTGKTVMAMRYISLMGHKTLFVVPTTDLGNQVVESSLQFLGIPYTDIGTIGGKKHKQPEDPQITVGIINSVAKMSKEELAQFDLVVLDEVHRYGSNSGIGILKNCCSGQIVLGLTATFMRADSKEGLLSCYLGKKIIVDQREQQIKDGHIVPFKVQPVYSSFTSYINGSDNFSGLKRECALDRDRNELIVSEALKAQAEMGKIVVIAADMIDQVAQITQILSGRGISYAVLTSNESTAGREQALQACADGSVKVLVATLSLIKEGVDCKYFYSMVISSGKFVGTTLQSVGRVLRPAPGKTHAMIVDICDLEVGILENQHTNRIESYKSINGTILDTETSRDEFVNPFK